MMSKAGYAHQRTIRNTARVVSLVFLAGAIWCVVVGIRSVVAAADSFEDDGKFWMIFIAMGLFFLAVVSAQVGFGGAVGRYYAGEAAPVLRDTIRTVTGADAEDGASPTAGRTGRFCSACGVRQDSGANFCDACGAPIGG